MNLASHQSDLVIWGGTILTMDENLKVLDDGIVTISQGKITSVKSRGDEKPSPGVEYLDARGCLVIPGLINGHTHLGMTLLRGIADDLPLDQWLHQHIFPLERSLGSKDFVELGTQLACLELIKGGVTTVNDMYYFEDIAAKAVHEIGMRAICGQTHLEISGVEKSSEMLKKFDSFFQEIEKYPLVQGAVAPHSIYGLSPKLWKEIVQYSEQNKVTIHTHLCETQEEGEKVLKERGLSPVKWFESIGLFEKRVICAHSVELNSEDISILGKNQVGIVYNPESNFKLGNRICPVVDLRKSGAKVAFGTDSTASNNNLNLLQEADFGTKVQTLKYGVGQLTARDSVKMLTVEGARALHLDQMVGSLEVGKSADLAVLALSEPHSVPVYDWYSHLIYGASPADVLHTVINGKVIMRNRQILTCDEKEVLDRARQWGIRISKLNASLQSSQSAN